MTDHVRVAVVGGGVTGLCTAYYLSQSLGSEQVILLEASDILGGQTQSSAIDGFLCDWGPNGFLDREPATLKWISDLGGSNDLIRANEASAHRFDSLRMRWIEAARSVTLNAPLASRTLNMCEHFNVA